jgi:glycosyltransferase involved in cell wall biosynthesis
MRIGIDLFSFEPAYSGGVNTFALGLIKGLLNNIVREDSLVFIVSEKNEVYIKSIFADKSITFVLISGSKFGEHINRLLWLLSWVTRNFKLRFWYDKYFRSEIRRAIDESVDVVVSPLTLLNFYAINAPTILCIHDIQQEYHPEYFTTKQLIARWAPYRLSCWKANAIQASSLYIKNCLIEKYKFVAPEKVFIAYEGIDLDKFSKVNLGTRPESVPDLAVNSFVFYPAQLWPHKNHLLLVEALRIFREKMGYEVPCVLTGYDYGHWKLVREQIERSQLKHIHYLGRVSYSDLLWLYQNCRAVLALGLHESSSLPVREGAVFGKPLISADIQPNIETQAFLRLEIVDKNDPGDLANTFEKLLTDSQSMFAASAENVKLVKIFDWSLIAKKYIDVLNKLANGKPIGQVAKLF